MTPSGPAPLVCLDTHILVWGVLHEATKGREPMIERAQRFLKYLDEEHAHVLVPAVVVAELLVKVPVENHPKVLQVLRKYFAVVPFDAAAACRAAEVIQRNGGLAKGAGREAIKTDCQIVATALVHRATVIYSEDPHISKLAEGFIKVETMPSIPEQTLLPFSERKSKQEKRQS